MTITNAREISFALDGELDEVVEQHRQYCGKLALDGWSMVVAMSPVDTGRYRAAHILSEGGPVDAVPDVAERFSAPSPDAARSVAEGADQYPVLILQNNVEYAQALETGSSEQAPEGIYARMLARLEAFLK